MPWHGRPADGMKSSPVLIEECQTYLHDTLLPFFPYNKNWTTLPTLHPLSTALPRLWLQRRIFWLWFGLLSKFFDLLLLLPWLLWISQAENFARKILTFSLFSELYCACNKLLVGESGLGKSTLINSLFLSDLYPHRVPLSATGMIF